MVKSISLRFGDSIFNKKCCIIIFFCSGILYFVFPFDARVYDSRKEKLVHYYAV